MPKTNVDVVTLVAINELAKAVNPNKTWRLPASAPAVGNKIANWIDIETMGAIVAEEIGAGVNRPDRVYIIGDDGSGNPAIESPIGDDIELYIDTDPGSPTEGYPIGIIDPYLDGLDYSNHLRGIEYLIKGTEWQNDIPGGGWRYTDGRIIEVGQIITISIKPEISNVIVSPDAVARFSNGIQVVTADTILGPSFQRKIIFLNSATTTLTVTLDDTYPENVICCLLTASGNQKQTTINAPGGQDIYHNGVKTSIFLGESEYANLVRIGTRWYVTSISDNWQKVGHIVYGGIPGPNTIGANGQTLQIAENPRLNDYLTRLNAALPGSVISTGAWTTDNTKWARNDTIILVPKLNGWFLRGLDLGAGNDPGRSGSNAAKGQVVGDKESMQVEAHGHLDPAKPTYKRILPPTNGGAHQTAATFGPTGRPATWPGVTDSAELQNYGGAETRPANIGLPILICI